MSLEEASSVMGCSVKSPSKQANGIAIGGKNTPSEPPSGLSGDLCLNSGRIMAVIPFEKTSEFTRYVNPFAEKDIGVGTVLAKVTL